MTIIACPSCKNATSTRQKTCKHCGSRLDSLNAKKWLISVFGAAAIIIYFFAYTDGPMFDEENLLNPELTSTCIRGHNGYEGRHYEKYCEGKSISVRGFFQEKDDDEYTFSTQNIGFGVYKFYVYPDNPSSLNYDKAIIQGVLDDYSILGKARIRNAQISRTELESWELDSRKTDIRYKSIQKNKTKILQAYRQCAMKFMATKPGTDCPVTNDRNQVTGNLNPNGSVQIDGLCFFGNRSITFQCRYKYGQATINDYKIH